MWTHKALNAQIAKGMPFLIYAGLSYLGQDGKLVGLWKLVGENSAPASVTNGQGCWELHGWMVFLLVHRPSSQKSPGQQTTDDKTVKKLCVRECNTAAGKRRTQLKSLVER